jgi:hypothetical protein
VSLLGFTPELAVPFGVPEQPVNLPPPVDVSELPAADWPEPDVDELAAVALELFPALVATVDLELALELDVAAGACDCWFWSA